MDEMTQDHNTGALRIMVVGGHPCDVFDHCGGTISHHVKNGDQVTCVALTQGLRIHDEVISEVLRFGTEGYSREELDRMWTLRGDNKCGEVRAACEIFGVKDVRFLNYSDKMLQVTMELIDEMAKVIRDVRPHIVITHYPQSFGNVTNHHGNAAKIVLDGAALAGTVDLDDPNPAWRVPQFAFMVNPGDCMAFDAVSGHCQAVPNYYVDVTDEIENIVKALDKIHSQQYDGPYARKSVETHMGVFGSYTRNAYCEAYVLLKPDVGRLLPLSDFLRDVSNEPEIDMIYRTNRLLTHKVPYEGERDMSGVF